MLSISLKFPHIASNQLANNVNFSIFDLFSLIINCISIETVKLGAINYIHNDDPHLLGVDECVGESGD